jgi:hypothetical protein
LISRRSVLKGAAAGLGGALLPPGCASPPSGLIAEENAKPGTSDWILAKTRAVQKCRCPWVEGYCSKTSLRAGETLEINVSTNPESPFEIDLYRMGYYRGKGGRFMARLGPFRGKVQPDPEPGEGRVRACSWETSAELAIPSDWPSGVYLGKQVFNAATSWWSLGLSEPPGFQRPSAHGSMLQGPDPRVQRMTRNLFDRFLA